jgi:hypothetical protein
MTGKSYGSILTAHAPTISVEARQSAVVVPTSAARMARVLRSIFASHYWEELRTGVAKKGTYADAKIRERGK